ncbi:hypothetical protein [Flavobacterium sp.]|uniref:hypothetical protein n=1 Tax=Flavobacterium sp. TaxID=239 RepID=UPI00261E9D43|nr:hypothetical protein [Flavobacterium sp.]
MKKTDLFIGFIVGIVAIFIGSYLFVKTQTDYDLISDFKILKNEGLLGKIFALGAILNIIIFFVLLKKNKELMARGIVMATLILAITTMFL